MSLNPPQSVFWLIEDASSGSMRVVETNGPIGKMCFGPGHSSSHHTLYCVEEVHNRTTHRIHLASHQQIAFTSLTYPRGAFETDFTVLSRNGGIITFAPQTLPAPFPLQTNVVSEVNPAVFHLFNAHTLKTTAQPAGSPWQSNPYAGPWTSQTPAGGFQSYPTPWAYQTPAGGQMVPYQKDKTDTVVNAGVSLFTSGLNTYQNSQMAICETNKLMFENNMQQQKLVVGTIKEAMVMVGTGFSETAKGLANIVKDFQEQSRMTDLHKQQLQHNAQAFEQTTKAHEQTTLLNDINLEIAKKRLEAEDIALQRAKDEAELMRLARKHAAEADADDTTEKRRRLN